MDCNTTFMNINLASTSTSTTMQPYALQTMIVSTSSNKSTLTILGTPIKKKPLVRETI
jgi:hypothetical protein